MIMHDHKYIRRISSAVWKLSIYEIHTSLPCSYIPKYHVAFRIKMIVFNYFIRSAYNDEFGVIIGLEERYPYKREKSRRCLTGELT